MAHVDSVGSLISYLCCYENNNYLLVIHGTVRPSAIGTWRLEYQINH